MRIWPYDRADGGNTIDVLRQLRAEVPTGKLIVLWDKAPYHRAKMVWSAAAGLDIHLLPLPGYKPGPDGSRAAVALAARGCHLPVSPCHR